MLYILCTAYYDVSVILILIVIVVIDIDIVCMVSRYLSVNLDEVEPYKIRGLICVRFYLHRMLLLSLVTSFGTYVCLYSRTRSYS
jgi:hypothetical protein